ncbi:MAG TPA: hypothetical protein PLZ55_11155, partial [bacterium]|nr:hypothetical protein [bacterium]
EAQSVDEVKTVGADPVSRRATDSPILRLGKGGEKLFFMANPVGTEENKPNNPISIPVSRFWREWR